jgi:hypothetical protein
MFYFHFAGGVGTDAVVVDERDEFERISLSHIFHIACAGDGVLGA